MYINVFVYYYSTEKDAVQGRFTEIYWEETHTKYIIFSKNI